MHSEYQTLLGSLAGRTGRTRLGVGVTEPVRRHPVLIVQAMVTLAHLTTRAPILGIGFGERVNITPYGLDGSHPVDRLEEAVQIIRICGTPAQVKRRLREYGEAGMRHVAIAPVSFMLTQRDARYGAQAVARIARALRNGRGQ